MSIMLKCKSMQVIKLIILLHIQIKLLLQTNINLWMRILKSISHFLRKAMLLIVEKKKDTEN